eukprot:scaffold161008_cov37-Tisochrysis_lutea.AAC.2
MRTLESMRTSEHEQVWKANGGRLEQPVRWPVSDSPSLLLLDCGPSSSFVLPMSAQTPGATRARTCHYRTTCHS